MPFLMLKFLKYVKFPLPYHIVYCKKRPTFVVYPHLARGSGCFVFAVSSASGRSSTKRNTTFLKIPKLNHIKIVIFRKYFSHHLWFNIVQIQFNLFLLWHLDLFYFFAQFSAKKSVLKTLF